MVSRDEILIEIQRIATATGGKPPGVRSFASETGIQEHDWAGRYWATWGEAVAEAGFQPNTMNARTLSDKALTVQLADLARELGHYPTARERMMKRKSDPDFMNARVFERRLGGRKEVLRLLVDFASEHPGYETVLECCEPLLEAESDADRTPKPGQPGYVYLIQMDKWHKIGATKDILRRQGEIRLTLPEKERLVHTIETDDPFGVEKYWQKRFSHRQTQGEWFKLTSADVNGFKRWRRIF